MRIRLPLLAVALLCAAAPAPAQRHELVEPGEDWRYFKGTAEPSLPVDAWRMPGFDDSGWAVGPTGIGYGDGDDATVLADMANGYVSVYARKAFTVADPAALAALWLDLAYDDGFVAYLNGTEVARAAMPAGTPAFDTRAAVSHDASMPERFDLTPFLGLLVAGTNLLAIEGHNVSSGSGDFSLVPRLFADGPNAITRGPFLQLQDAGSITVVWRTASASIGEVFYGRGALTARAAETAPATEHAVRLAGLVPGALYTYAVGEGGLPTALPRTFRAARSPAEPSFRLLAFGDSGSHNIPQWNVARLIESLAPDLVVQTGDLVYDNGEAENYDPHYFEPNRRIIDRCLFWPTLGNHDWRTASGQPFADAFRLPPNGGPLAGEHWYSFTYSDTLFVALDSTPGIVPGDPQHAWLEAQLRDTTACFKVVFFHHPPYNAGLEHGSDLAIRSALEPLFDRYGVDLVLSGHEHSYGRSFPIRAGAAVSAAQEPDYVDPGGTIYIVTGGGGRALYATGTDWFSAHTESIHHVTVLDRSGDTWSIRAIEADGTPGGREADRAGLRRSACAPSGYTVYRSPNKDDVPARPLFSTFLRTWADPDPPSPAVFYYQVEPTARLDAVRRGGEAELSW